ncbi:hypothetical protein EV178_000642 [Coemansia sp. RSA 1646]|nr:hypothetical protein EV178_000642 [Coemansia sp. RSA 1646]
MSSSPPPPSLAYSRARKKESRLPASRRDMSTDTQQPINYHSRSAAREQLRKQKQQQQQQQQEYTGGGVLADINALREQQSRNTAAAHSAFVSGPLDSLSTSAYVSGHLTPSDQWVAIGNESSSGVISLTSTDTEEEPPDSAVGSNDDNGSRRKGKQVAAPYSDKWTTGDRQGAEFQIPIDAQYHQQKPLEQQNELANYPQPQAIISSSASRWDPEYDDLEEQQAVHLLRESVASLLSSGGTASSAASSALSGNPAKGASSNSRRKGSSRIRSGGNRVGGSGAYYKQSHSPSNISKISEPCYHPSSEPRKQFTANFDHFSDVALSSTATPSYYYQHRHSHRNMNDRLQAAGDSGSRPRNAHFPTYEEFKRQQQQQQQQTQSAQSSTSPSAVRRRMNADDSVDADTIVPMSPSLGKQKMYTHPFLSEQSDGYSLFLSDTSRPLSPSPAAVTGKLSPFASIRTVSPIIVHRPAETDPAASEIAVQRAQAEAALEQTILCPIKSFDQFGAEYHRLDATRPSDDKRAYASGIDHGSETSETAGNDYYVQGWARYTSYAIVGFGVGTLVGVGMLYFDMAANATPKATRTIPIAGF